MRGRIFAETVRACDAMPSGAVHLFYGFFTGLAVSSYYKEFTPPLVIVYGVSNFLGPDLGTWGEWFVENVAYMPDAARFALSMAHSVLGYMLFLSVPLAYVFSRKSFWKYIAACDRSNVSFTEALRLTVAGGLAHFFLETLFEEDGRDPLYRRILSTGSFDTPQYLPAHIIIIVGIFTISIPCIFVRTVDQGHERCARALAKLLILYCTYFAIAKYLFDVAPAGEEADLGVILFLVVFLALPVALCVNVAEERRRSGLSSGNVDLERHSGYAQQCKESETTATSLLPSISLLRAYGGGLLLLILNVCAFALMVRAFE